jgi:exosortase B
MRSNKSYILILISFLILFVPSYQNLIAGAWRYENQSHGPIVLGIILFLLWRDRLKILSTINLADDNIKLSPSLFIGVFLFVMSIFFYVIGRSQNIEILDIGSQIPMIIGVFLILFGYEATKLIFFPILFLIFIIPFPGYIIDAITLPMKIAVSTVTDNILYYFNYPIARTGVILQIGQYQLLVADACAGMQTLLSLEALGLLYLKLIESSSTLRNIVLSIMIIPISFTANVIRVITLTLITFYYGNEVGQGFIHGFAGMFLFIVALIMIIIFDNLLNKIQFYTRENKIE